HPPCPRSEDDINEKAARGSRAAFVKQLTDQAAFSRLTLHFPSAASPFIFARCRCAFLPASAFLPAHACSAACCSARPYENVSFHGCGPSLFISSRCAVASSSDWPPERNAM